ncbi:S-layer homology domain-containing protein [Cohnella lupini]|uniref:Ricin-type beta-trefoil lectin protein n=1 Tax=Cohnella lupini TaxID=1294267 RepID=A0A3D9IT00_9BACL|nr:S-layer homology domain-containing protein [Cohnella lupini]RED64884.1 ricin-type beta-trefoil lectin protein [Cohnella lupini]
MKVLRRLLALSLALIIMIPPLSASADDDNGTGGSDYFRIKNTLQGHYLYEDSDGKVRYGFTEVNDPHAQWLVENQDGHQRIKNRATGHYLNSQSVTDENITRPLESSAAPSTGSDTWDIADVANKPGEVNIVSTRNAAWIVNFEIRDGYVQSNGWAQKEWGSATWKLEPAEETAPVRIANLVDGTYLYEEAGSFIFGNPALNNTASHWFVEENGGNKQYRNRSTGQYLTGYTVTEEMIAPASDSLPKRVKNQWKGTYLYEDNGQIKYGDPVYTDMSSQWIVIDATNGKRLRNVATGKYATSVDYVGATPLATTTSLGADAVWKQEAAKTDQGNEVEGFVTFRSVVSDNSFVNVQNQDGFAQGNNWAQATWGSAQWKLEDPAPPTPPANPFVRIKNDWLQLYLYEDNGLVKYGNVEASDQNAQWLIEDADGAKRIKNHATGHYLNSGEGANARDALKSSALAPDSTDGDWKIATNGQGLKLISKPGEENGGANDDSGSLTDELGNYINVENKLKHAQYGVVNATWGSPKWEFVTVTDTVETAEFYRLKNDYRGTYLYEAADGKVAYGQPEPTDETSHWALQQGSQGTLIVNRATGHFITNEHINRDPINHPDGHLDPLESLDLDPTWGSVQWTVYGVQGTDNVKVFNNDWNGNAVIHVEDETGYGQASDIPSDWGTAKWVLERTPNPPIALPEGNIRIKNKASGQYLYENGNNVVLYGNPEANNASSHWILKKADGTQRIENRATGNVISIANLQSYLETTASSVVNDNKANWTVEKGTETGVYLIRSEADGFKDAYIHTADSQGYAQYELRSVESPSVQWIFEDASAEAVNVPWDNGPANAVTPALSETNYVRITDALTGKALIERNGAIVTEVQASENDASSQWMPQDYNGRKRLVNRATGHFLALNNNGAATASNNGAELFSQWKLEAHAGYTTISNASAAESHYLALGESGGATSQALSDGAIEAHWLAEPVSGETRYEAENAFMTGGVTANGSVATGFAAVDAALLFSVNAEEAKSYDATIRYRNASAGERSLSVYVNGLKQAESVAFSPTGSAVSGKAIALSLRAGMNTVALQVDDGDSGQVDIDALLVKGSVNKQYRGATLPFTTYEAEHGTTNGTLLQQDRTFKTFTSEASGREAVTLDATGQYVEFKTTKQANSLVVRYIVPDSETGEGANATLSLYVNGESRGKLRLTSEHSWVYGKYPWSNNPADGDAHRFFDESHQLIGDVPAGATIRLQKDGDDAAQYYVIDLVELEQAADAYAKPDGYLSVADFGAIADDANGDGDAFLDAIAAAKEQGVGLWIPAGLFLLDKGPLQVDNITIRGAGMWHTTLQGAGFIAEGNKIRVYDLLLDVNVTARRDAEREAGFDGTFGTGSVIQNVWIEHAKAGIWSMRSEAGVSTNGLYVGNVRIRNTYADGINLTTGTSNSMIEQTHIRNSGDDSVALWSQKPEGVSEEESRTSGNTIRFNTIQLPWLADNVAIFGGRDNKVQDNVLADTVGFGAGIAVSTRFNPVAFDGTTTVERNTLIRTGGREHNWSQDFGAIWIFTGDKAIDADIVIRDNTALDSTYQGLYINGPNAIANANHKILIQNYVVDGAGTWGIHVNSSVTGSVELDNVILRNAKVGSVFNAMGAAFELRTTSTQPDEEEEEESGPTNGGSGVFFPANADRDAQLNAEVSAGKQEILIDLSSGNGTGEAFFTVDALRKAASSLPNAKIVLKFGDLSYELPSNIIAILESAGFEKIAAGAKLNIKLSTVSETIASDVEEKAGSAGFRIAGKPVSFELALEAGGTFKPIHSFGKQFVTRAFVVEGELDDNRSSVIVFDLATGLFRTVPALFSVVDGRTVVTVKSATNSIYAVAVSDVSFGDIAAHWAKEDIALMANKRIASGVSANEFAPNRNVSRAEFAALVVRSLGLNATVTAGTTGRFADVPSNAWYADQVKTAAEFGIISGGTNGTFAPDREVTRQEMAVMLANAIRLTQAKPAIVEETAVFGKDGSRIASWARSSVEELVQAGIMKGKTSDSFAPQDKATRAEATVALKRMLQAVGFMN